MGKNEEGAIQEKIVCPVCLDTGEIMVAPDRIVGGNPVDAVYEKCYECYPQEEQDYDEWRDNQA